MSLEKIAINPDRLDKLITALRTAVDNDGTLDKESTSYNDIFDALRLVLKSIAFRKELIKIHQSICKLELDTI